MLTSRTPFARLLIGSLAVVSLAACGDSDDGATDTASDVGDADGTVDVPADEASLPAAVTTYADGVFASYSASVESARAMDAAIDAFIADPTDAAMQTAKDAWLAARDDYGLTEAFRFYGGPIDNDEAGPEGLINAWPMDEAYVDYVDGDAAAGIINDPTGYPAIDAALLESLNEDGGETNISTGWHAIEFLLWGQDLSEDGPGVRGAADYVDAANADRRGAYLATASDLLVTHLQSLVDAWDPATDGNYRSEFLALDPEAAMTNIFTGIGELSRGELAGERMNVAYSERSQEDEHSCFSDNTTADLVANAAGIEMVVNASYPGGVTGTSIVAVVSSFDPALAGQLSEQVAASVAAVSAIPAPFDQHLRDGVPDSDPGRMSILAGIEALEAQTPTIVSAAEALGLTINVT